ncbi:UvrD-helicase domain-containing protein [soil metagenome]
MSTANTFTVYNASAGSGKTYTLVKEYILLLLRGRRHDGYKNILAITFTNKAVAEMKTRVVLNLNNLAATPCPEDTKNLMQDLKKETGFSEEFIRNKSREILKSILHNYAAFDISTIDRFTHKIIRTFAKDLGLPSGFEVELNSIQILQEAIDRLINKAGEDKDLTKVLVDFTLSKTDEDKSWDISRDLFVFAKILLYENHQPYVNALKEKSLEDYHNFAVKVKTRLKKTETDLDNIATEFFEILKREGLEKMDFLGGYCFSYFLKLAQKDYKLSFDAKWQTNIEEQKLYAGKCHHNKKEILDQHHTTIAGLFKSSQETFYLRDHLKQILLTITPLSLLSMIAAQMEEIKKERSLVLISDFNPTIAAQVKNQPAPFIYERLGERYRNYFIDEFQDTSEMQWTNIVPLIDHALSAEQDHNEMASLTLVGDAKQSIYRFRGGKAEQFIGLYNLENPFTIIKNVNNLEFNYRSASDIVEFNNSFFKYVSAKFSSTTYTDLFATSGQIAKSKDPGYVSITFLEAANAEEENEVHPAKIMVILDELQSKNVKLSEVCILTRTGKQGITVANYLSAKGISIVSSESLLVSNSPEVNFITTLFEFVLNDEDKNLKWEILNFLVHRLEIKNKHEIIFNNLEKTSGEFFNWLRDYGIDFDSEEIKILPLPEAAEYMIRSFGLVQRSNAYIQFYLDFIFHSTKTRPLGILEFLELWELNKEKLSIIAPKTDNAVQIMTIHKSKGLEFPIVIYPFANTHIKDVSKEYLWLKLPPGMDEIPFGYFKASSNMRNWGENEAAVFNERVDQTEFDNVNILYVALTRAAKQLYILSCPEFKNGEPKTDKVSGLLIDFLIGQNKWDGTFHYEFGEKYYPETKKYKKSTSLHPNKFFSTAVLSARVKLVTRPGELWGTLQEKAMTKGNLVHNILGEITTAMDLPSAFQKFMEKEKLPVTSQDEVLKLLHEVIRHPELEKFYSGGDLVYLERDIVSPTGDVLRPDRLNINGLKVSIIDYKTGSIQAGHSEQMWGYENILKEMGYEVDEKILIYINNEVNLTYV